MKFKTIDIIMITLSWTIMTALFVATLEISIWYLPAMAGWFVLCIMLILRYDEKIEGK